MILDGKRTKRLFFSLVLVVFLAVLTACSAGYVHHLAVNQLRISQNSIPIEEVLENKSLSAESRRKLTLILEAKQFGEEELGLKKTKNYTTYVNIEKKYVGYIVSASSKYELKSYQWRFPIAGTLLYKGFFDLNMAKKEKEKLEGMGLDTYLRPVAAYSTLGWFKDPVFSPMLKHDDAELINIAIHELMHATVYRKNHPKFNEGLATFVGNQGSLLFLKRKFGSNSREYQDAGGAVHDSRIFSEFLKTVHQGLTDFYGRDIPNEEKLKGREKIFSDSKQRLLNLKDKFKTDLYIKFYEKAKLNNAFILSLSQYLIGLEDFIKAFELWNQDMKKTIAFFKSDAFKENDPAGYLKKWIEKKGSLK